MTPTAPAAASESEMTIRRAASMTDVGEISDLVESVTGYRDIHPAVLHTVIETGGHVAGAYDQQGRCVGGVYGLIGVRDGSPFLHSEMLAVQPDMRGTHVARALKLDQRAFALEAGMEQVTWTYDPLRGVNANLNIRLLGCNVVGYKVDMYGELPGYSSGWPTDQLLLEWRLRSERVERVLSGSTPDTEGPRATVVETSVRPDGLLVFDRVLDSDNPIVLLEIPDSIQAMRWLDMNEVLRWRLGVRTAFQTYLGRGYEVIWFLSRTEGRRRNFYVLEKPGANDDEPH